jgi:phage head maturation protease
VSVGFLPNRTADQWTRDPETGLPRVHRQDCRLIDLSTTLAPAYKPARITATRSAPGPRPYLEAVKLWTPNRDYDQARRSSSSGSERAWPRR